MQNHLGVCLDLLRPVIENEIVELEANDRDQQIQVHNIYHECEQEIQQCVEQRLVFQIWIFTEHQLVLLQQYYSDQLFPIVCANLPVTIHELHQPRHRHV